MMQALSLIVIPVPTREIAASDGALNFHLLMSNCSHVVSAVDSRHRFVWYFGIVHCVHGLRDSQGTPSDQAQGRRAQSLYCAIPAIGWPTPSTEACLRDGAIKRLRPTTAGRAV